MVGNEHDARFFLLIFISDPHLLNVKTSEESKKMCLQIYSLVENFHVKNNKDVMNKDQIFGVVRHVLTAVGGILIAKGVIDDALWGEIVGGALSLAATIWSVVDKRGK
jgi:hypothetical protein